MDLGVVQASTRGSSHPVHRENRRRSSTTTEPHINQRGKKTFVEAIQIEIFKCSILKTPRGVYHAHKQFCLHSLFLCVSSRPRQHVEGISRHQGGKMCRLNVFKSAYFPSARTLPFFVVVTLCGASCGATVDVRHRPLQLADGSVVTAW